MQSKLYSIQTSVTCEGMVRTLRFGASIPMTRVDIEEALSLSGLAELVRSRLRAGVEALTDLEILRELGLDVEQQHPAQLGQRSATEPAQLAQRDIGALGLNPAKQLG